MFSRTIRWFSQPKLAHWFFLLIPVLLLLPMMLLPQTLDDLVHHHVFAKSLPMLTEANWWFDLFVFLDGEAARTQQVIQQFLLPWWAGEEIKIAFFRPLSALTHWVDFQLWPGVHALNHLHSFVWLGMLIAVVFKFYKTLEFDYLIAILGALLFAFDASHFITATWVANRNLLVAAVIGVVCLLAHIKSSRDESTAWYALSLMLFLLCLLSAEAGVSIGAFILSYTFIIDRSSWKKRLFVLAGYGVIFLLWYYQYKTMGYGASGNNFYLDPGQNPVAYLQALSWKYPLYVLMYFIGLPSLIYYPGGVPTEGLLLVSILLVVLLTMLLWPLLRSNRLARFWLLSFLLSLLPIAGSSPHERTMVIAGIAANALMATLIVSIFQSGVPVAQKAYQFLLGRTGKWLLLPVLWLFLLLHVVIHPLGLVLVPAGTLALHEGNLLEQQVEALPEIEVNQKGRVYLNSPSTLFVSTLSLYSAMDENLYSAMDENNNEQAKKQFLLASGAKDIQVRRLDNNKIRVFSPQNIRPSIYDQLFRSEGDVISTGERFSVGDMQVQVVKVNDNGLPFVVDYTWPYSLEQLQVLAWTGEHFEPVDLPKTKHESALVIESKLKK